MKYPYLKTVHEEIADGGMLMLLSDLILFCVKVFLFVFFAIIAFWCFATVLAEKLSSHMSTQCLQQLVISTQV